MGIRMNQSLIVSWVISFLMKVKALYLDSAAHHILNRLFLFFSSLWNRSRVVGWLIRDYGGSDGFFRRIFRMIMTCPQRLAEKLEKPIDKALSGSLFVAMLRGFIHSFLALNTRFLSIICYSSPPAIFPSTPFIKDGALSELNFLASSTASLITTFLGVKLLNLSS